MHKGSCLCGAVRFEVTSELEGPDACHCTQCRKSSGHYFVSVNVPREALTVEGGDNVAWFQSSEKVRRGFCRTCGSQLFWDPIFKKEWTSIAMGAFEKPTDTKLALHIYVADKGDYYDIADDAPQYQQTPLSA
jgi:hypothetical protein